MGQSVDEKTVATWRLLQREAGDLWRDYYQAYCVTTSDPAGFRTSIDRFCRSRMHNDHALLMYLGPHTGTSVLVGYAASKAKAVAIDDIPPGLIKHADALKLDERVQLRAQDRRERFSDFNRMLYGFISARKTEGFIFVHKHYSISGSMENRDEFQLYSFFR